MEQILQKWRETGGPETQASPTYYSCFPPPSLGVPACLFYFYCKMLRNMAKFFSFSPTSLPFSCTPPASFPPPAPYSPGLLPPVPPYPERSKSLTTKNVMYTLSLGLTTIKLKHQILMFTSTILLVFAKLFILMVFIITYCRCNDTLRSI